jgi:hypothetical protein
MRTTAYVVCVLMLAVIVSGCGFTDAFVETKVDPVTGEDYKVLTPVGQAAAEGGKTIVKVLTGPLGIPPGIWDTLVTLGLGALGIEGTRRVANRVKKSKPGDLVG